MTGRVGAAGAIGRAAAPAAWVLAGGAVVLAVGLALSIPDDLDALHGLPRVAAWASVVLLAGGVAAGGSRLAPLAAVAVTLAATAALVDEGAPVDATALGIGAAGWLCLELTASSLEARSRRRSSVRTVLRRLATVAVVVVLGAVVGLAALTVATDATAEHSALRSAGVLAAVGLVALVTWLARDAVRPWRERPPPGRGPGRP